MRSLFKSDLESLGIQEDHREFDDLVLELPAELHFEIAYAHLSFVPGSPTSTMFKTV